MMEKKWKCILIFNYGIIYFGLIIYLVWKMKNRMKLFRTELKLTQQDIDNNKYSPILELPMK